jgi:L-threonylcarbamoyladenylate synthase
MTGKDKIIKLNPQRVSSEVITRTTKIIRNGGIIIYPTETVYGIGCDALNIHSVGRLYAIKKRPEAKPALILIKDTAMLKRLVANVPPVAVKLMKRFWPGPLTITFQARKTVSKMLTAGSGKIGVRISSNRFCEKLIAECNTPIVSTSANISGEPALNEIETLKQIFVHKVDAIIDAGDLVPSLPSTVVDVADGMVNIIREGRITRTELQE